MPATPSTRLTSVSRFKDHIADSGSAKDTYYATILDRASLFIEGQCRRKFKQQTYTTEMYDGTGEPYLYLRNAPLVSVSSVQYRSGDSWTDEVDFANQLNISDTDERGFVFWLDGRRFGDGLQNYRLTYVAGYSTSSTSLPEDLQQAVILLTEAFLFDQQRKRYLSSSINTADGGSMLFNERTIPEFTKMVIDYYRLHGWTR